MMSQLNIVHLATSTSLVRNDQRFSRLYWYRCQLKKQRKFQPFAGIRSCNAEQVNFSQACDNICGCGLMQSDYRVIAAVQNPRECWHAGVSASGGCRVQQTAGVL